MDSTNKVLAALCYFSLFFAGFIFPLIVYFVSNEKEVKRHAVSAIISHIIPVIFIPIVILSVLFDIGVLSIGGFPVFFIGFFLLFGVISLIIVIWNIYRGVKVLL
ncbi:hypothetical protein BLX88_19060 [Bacillus obstructivus]|nr:hypothetical protein BLX88_19060 [Bacillus obstructivus]